MIWTRSFKRFTSALFERSQMKNQGVTRHEEGEGREASNAIVDVDFDRVRNAEDIESTAPGMADSVSFDSEKERLKQ